MSKFEGQKKSKKVVLGKLKCYNENNRYREIGGFMKKVKILAVLCVVSCMFSIVKAVNASDYKYNYLNQVTIPALGGSYVSDSLTKYEDSYQYVKQDSGSNTSFAACGPTITGTSGCGDFKNITKNTWVSSAYSSTGYGMYKGQAYIKIKNQGWNLLNEHFTGVWVPDKTLYEIFVKNGK